MSAERRKWNWICRGWWWPRIPFAILLVTCGAWAYRPALSRVFAGDQFGYFAELQGETSLKSGFRLLDYSVQRQYWKGDQMCYRPLLFAGLAMENALFQRDFRLWNAANLGLHLAVGYLLFEMLWQMRRSLLACGFALWFALLLANFELVTWNHLGGYMLGYGLLLLSLYARGKMEEEEHRVRWFWVYAIAMICAMLEHEIAVVACACIAAHGLWSRQRRQRAWGWRWIASLGAPFLIYSVLYAFHVFSCDRLLWVNSSGGGIRADCLADWPFLLLRWAQHIILPRYDQLASAVGGRSLWLSWPGGMTAEGIAAVALWAGLFIGLRRGLSWHRQTSIWPLGNFMLVLIAAYAGLNLMGRPGYVLFVPYYDYFPALFGVVWLYSRIDVSRVGRRGMMGAFACIVMLALVNGWQVRQVSGQIQEMNRSWAHYLGWVEKTVRSKLSSPEYSFAMRGTPEELVSDGELMVGYPDQNQVVKRHVLHVLYGESYDPYAPSERLVYPGVEAGLR